jgi:hypothetical protein
MKELKMLLDRIDAKRRRNLHAEQKETDANSELERQRCFHGRADEKYSVVSGQEFSGVKR